MGFGLADFVRYFSEVATFPIIPPDSPATPPNTSSPSGLACIGTPDDCIRHFERLWKGSEGGMGGSCCWRTTGPTGRRRKSYELMARYVHPHFQRNGNALRVFSYDDAKDQARDRRHGDAAGRAGRDREASGGEG